MGNGGCLRYGGGGSAGGGRRGQGGKAVRIAGHAAAVGAAAGASEPLRGCTGLAAAFERGIAEGGGGDRALCRGRGGGGARAGGGGLRDGGAGRDGDCGEICAALTRETSISIKRLIGCSAGFAAAGPEGRALRAGEGDDQKEGSSKHGC